ncbi:hypothetical protein DFJ74DRAFT_772064 [Hyaloraphidium curvatum]|nr:hypothetical protein DFJ74DRAFT_772064 [Hyaloraphidium curvatum]
MPPRALQLPAFLLLFLAALAAAAPDTSRRAIVLVGGGAGSHAFSTPTSCSSSSFDTIRSSLARAGLGAYVAPARKGRNSTAPVPAADCVALGESLEVNSVAGVDEAGATLARFLGYLRDNHGKDTFDLVGYSYGGLVVRAAAADIISGQQANLTGLRVASVTTLVTPHQGSWSYDWVAGLLTDEQVVALVGEQGFNLTVGLKGQPDEGAGASLTTTFLNGPQGWNAKQAGVLQGVDVALLGGDALGGAGYLVHDGSVPLASQLCLQPDGAIPQNASRKVWGDVHSAFISVPMGMPREREIHNDVNGSVAFLVERMAKLWGKKVVTTRPAGAGRATVGGWAALAAAVLAGIMA